MGAVNSSNSANVASSIANTVKNSTVVSQEAIQEQVNKINLNKCDINTKGIVTVTIESSSKMRSEQQSNVSADTSLKNTCAQSALQSATAELGSLGIGAANANNSIAMMANISNEIVNTVTSSQRNIQVGDNTIVCNNTSITADGNVTFSISSSNELYQKLALENKNVTNVTNDITQTVKQTAESKVEGMTAALLAMAVLVVACAYAFTTVEAGTLGPILMVVAIILVIVLVICAWYFSWWPFFQELVPCFHAIPGLGMGQDRCTDCVFPKEMVRKATLLKSPPLKYLFPLFAVGSALAQPGAPIFDSTLFDIKKIALTIGSNPMMPKNNGQIATSLWDLAISANADPGASIMGVTAGTFNNAGYQLISLVRIHQAINSFNIHLDAFYKTNPNDKLLKALVSLILGKDRYKGKGKPIPPLLLDPAGNINSSIPATPVSALWPYPENEATYIKIPAQYQWSSAGINGAKGPSGQVDPTTMVTTGACTPRAFFWNGSTQECIKADGTQTSGQCNTWIGGGWRIGDNNCFVAGSWPWNKATPDPQLSVVFKGSDPRQSKLALASSNLKGFSDWMRDVSITLSEDPAIKEKVVPIISTGRSIAENLVFSFTRSLFVYLIDQSPKKFLPYSLQNNSYLKKTEQLGPGVSELIIITDFDSTTLSPLLITEKNPPKDAQKSQPEWGLLIGDDKKAPTIKDYIEFYTIEYNPMIIKDYNFTDALAGPGVLSAVAGECRNKDWKIHHWMETVGNYIFLFIILVAFAYIARVFFRD